MTAAGVQHWHFKFNTLYCTLCSRDFMTLEMPCLLAARQGHESHSSAGPEDAMGGAIGSESTASQWLPRQLW